jgi:hypothetical protein
VAAEGSSAGKDISDEPAPDKHLKFCPSAQPDMEGAVAFGVVGGTAESPAVSYLSEPQPVTSELLALAKPVEPTEVFRFGAPCAEQRCQHFDGTTCQLGRKLVQNVSRAVQRLPPCRLRPSCRWFHEQGGAVCLRCPLVVTTHYRPSLALREAANPTVEAMP